MKAAIGFRAHSGWAAAVAIGLQSKSPTPLGRWRIELADTAIPGAVQLYHAAEPMPFPEAEAFVRSCTESTRRMARHNIQLILKELGSQGHELTSAAILLSSARPLGDLAAILASHPLIHTAEGEFYRNAIIDACTFRQLRVVKLKEKDLLQQAAITMKADPKWLDQQLAEMGRALGPPWRQDQKLSVIAAWLSVSATSG